MIVGKTVLADDNSKKLRAVPPAGRGGQQRQLHATPGAGAARVLHGLLGVGKTQVALEYAYRHRSEYDVVWWVQCDKSPGAARASLAALAERLGLEPASSAGIDKAAAAALNALRCGVPYNRCLLIFNDADDPREFVSYMPDGPAHLLITSRNSRWRGALARRTHRGGASQVPS
jgi:hypothetical protein